MQAPSQGVASSSSRPPSAKQPRSAPRRSRGGRSQRGRPQTRPRGGAAPVNEGTEQAQTLIEQLKQDQYECSICSDKISRRGKVWSCSRCHIIIHNACIDKWFVSQTGAGERKESKGRSAPVSGGAWACPGCMFVFTDPPGQYSCFCGKVDNPEFSPFLTPHSCGDICGKPRGGGCPHPCNMLCHPGFCAPCGALGPLRNCACGKTTYQSRCGEVDKDAKVCNNVCGKKLSCGTHTCEKTCHQGPCGDCPVTLMQTCFCGNKEEKRPCGSAKEHNGRFSCGGICDLPLECGNHNCARKCHPGKCMACIRLPTQPQPCACGKTRRMGADQSDPNSIWGDALAKEKKGGSTGDEKFWSRRSCRDPLPTCGSVCDKILQCGTHACKLKCHDSACPPCKQMVTQRCRCGRATISMSCPEYTAMKKDNPSAELTCERPCKKQMSCGRHKCPQKCCVGEALGPGALTHVCSRSCNKPLECGIHQCSKFCHLGPCEPCAVVYRDGISCRCGRTKAKGVVLCGTPPPACKFRCSLPRNCPHPCMYKCHPGACAPCAVLTERMCAGGHRKLASIPCYAEAPSCGVTCSKQLPCGEHTCNRPCHAGPCVVPKDEQKKRAKPSIFREEEEDSKEEKEEKKVESKQVEVKENGVAKVFSCGQRCKRPREDCEHFCKASCHPGQDCPAVPCDEPVSVTCACKRIAKRVPCNAGSPDAEPASEQQIPCDDVCAKEKRNRAFREAFDTPINEEKLIPYPSVLLEQILALKLTEFVPKAERTFEEFLRSPELTKMLPPMSQPQRWFLHQAATYYGIETESHNKADKRSVRLVKDPDRGFSVPKVLISKALTLYVANKKQPQSAVRTIDPGSILSFFELDQEPRIYPEDLRHALQSWEGKYRLNSIDHSHAVAVFANDRVANEARQSLEAAGTFRSGPAPAIAPRSVHALYPRRSELPLAQTPPSPRRVTVSPTPGPDGFITVQPRKVLVPPVAAAPLPPPSSGAWTSSSAARKAVEMGTPVLGSGNNSSSPERERKNGESNATRSWRRAPQQRKDAWDDDTAGQSSTDSAAEGMESFVVRRAKPKAQTTQAAEEVPVAGNRWDLLEEDS